MDTFTNTILQKLRIFISLKILHNEENIGIYREIAKAKTPGRLLSTIKKLPEGELQDIKRVLDGDEKKKIILKPLKYSQNKYISPALSFKFSDGDFKRKQRLEALARIQKGKLK